MLVIAAALLQCVGCATAPTAATAPPPPTSAQAGATTIVAVAAPAGPQMTLPKFLGLDLLFGGARQVGQRVRNRLGSRFPGLESKPAMRSLSDPANTGPDASPEVQAAAEAKQEEDQAAQKAKAIRYLATKGCGECYPDTEKALLSSLEDCSEVIRYEAAKGLRQSVGENCGCCRENCCCTPDLLKKLYEIAYEKDETGCFVESSARVRRQARLVICKCGGVPPDEYESVPLEGPSGSEPLPAPAGEIAPAVEQTVKEEPHDEQSVPVGSALAASEEADSALADRPLADRPLADRPLADSALADSALAENALTEDDIDPAAIKHEQPAQPGVAAKAQLAAAVNTTEQAEQTGKVEVAGLVTESGDTKTQAATPVGFVLPDDVELPESTGVSTSGDE